MYLAGLLKPDFRTINEFRKNNLEPVRLAFQEVVRYAKDLGMVSLGHISIDGTKIKANASNNSAVKKDELPDGITRKTIVERVQDKYQAGDERRKDQIKKQLDKAQEEPEKADSAIRFTDPDCRFMPNGKKVTEYSYNPQVEENIGELPEGTKVSSDNGYYSSLNLKFLKEKRLDGYIPDLNTSTRMKGIEVKINPFSKENFREGRVIKDYEGMEIERLKMKEKMSTAEGRKR